jgi:HAD superfamily hydrolase (TIGR01456 family)
MRRALGFVFDIDGVLLRGKVALPTATASLQRLARARVPYIFLTNGGGETEAAKAASLSRLLGVPVHAEQLVLSHTPMRPLCRTLAEKRVLLLGCRDVRGVAASYGLQRVVTPEDLLAADEHVYPFLKAAPKRMVDEQFAAVLCFHDPNSWGLELQCTLDVLRGGGDGTTQAVPMFASNGDLTFAGAHAVPRLAAGSFHVALRAVWAATVSATAPLEINMFGKPTAATFSFARAQLARWAALADAHNAHAGIAGGAAQLFESERGDAGLDAAATDFEKIIMVGDNPLADIRGANAAGAPWVSVLVRSGMWRGGENDLAHPAQVVVGGVGDAVGKYL